MSDQPLNTDVGITTDSAEVTSVAPPTGGETGTDTSTSINPAWNELLEVIPSSLHPLMTPHLQKWDKGVQDRFQQVQSQYAPYKSFIDDKADPQELEAARQIFRALNSNPREFYDRMTQHYAQEWGLNVGGQGQEQNAGDDYSLEGLEGDDQENPLLKQLQEQQQMMVEFLNNDLKAREEAENQRIQEEADRQVESEIAEATAKYGAISDERMRMVLSYAASTNTPLPESFDFVMGQFGAAQQKQMTPILTPGGGTPLTQANPADMDKKQTLGLVQQILANANAAQTNT